MPKAVRRKTKTPESEVCEEDLVTGAVALLTGGQDLSYTYGLATTLSRGGTRVHVVGGDRVDHVEFHTSERISFVDLGGIQANASVAVKLFQLMAYYSRLLVYITFRSPRIVHILWNSKLEYFDRTLLTFYMKLLGKKVLLTAHNVNRAKRDLCDSILNRKTLGIQYRCTDHIFVHTEKMKDELVQEFGISPERVAVIPFGINILVPDTELTTNQAKDRLGIRPEERTILFYGRIVPYKGLECLVEAFHRLAPRDASARLMIAGEPMKGFEDYVEGIRRAIADNEASHRILCRLEFVPDHETELYFKAADVLVLPYKNIFESGVLFLAYRFGLPVIASDVGCFGEELTEGRAGLVFEPGNSTALADTLEAFFKSEFYKDAATYRHRIQAYSSSRHSWQTVGQITESVYSGLIKQRRTRDSGNLATADGAEQEGRSALPQRGCSSHRES
ncbi:MAG TPA: glycosyltransferase family 4 protein [Terriglobales bacterium]|jgi:D-inositol-3-phosphate glycosyltransferase|nr:glycosyltransferase family 4 protein [Terriglobales bacterium]